MLMSTKPCYSKQKKKKMFPYKLVDMYEGNQPLAAWTCGQSIGGNTYLYYKPKPIQKSRLWKS